MTDEREDNISVEAVEVVVDYDELFAERLKTLEQMIYEFRFRRGLKEGQESVAAFAQHLAHGAVDFTVRSSREGHIIIESYGKTVMIDFSNPEETLEITADDTTSALEPDAAGIFILTDVQKKLVAVDIDSLEA